MEIKNFFCGRGLLIVGLAALTACQTQTKSPAPHAASIPPKLAMPPGVSLIPPPAVSPPAGVQIPSANAAATSPPSQTPNASNRKVAVVLGPGGAKTFAHVGVLKAFQQQRIPIDKVVGLEWGALIGGLFASKGLAQDLEWKLYKMEQQKLPYPRGFFSKKPGEESSKVMDSFLSETFGKEQIGQTKINFMCPSKSILTGVVAWQTRGPTAEAVRRCLPFPPAFKAQGTFAAGVSQATEAVDRLIKEGFNVVVFVNVLGSAMPVGQDAVIDHLLHAMLWQEVRRAVGEVNRYQIDFVNVNTDDYPIMNFDSKRELISAGERAGQAAAGSLISKYGF
jgi:NTE family protein